MKQVLRRESFREARDEMTAYGLDVTDAADRLLRQQVIGAVATAVAIVAVAGLAFLT